MTPQTPVKRVFWLGMHKILRKTELPMLRNLGYEVFSPAYLASIYDQSADQTIDLDQPTTLPPHVFDTLIQTNFFYSEISPEVADLLNTWFDCVIVTINPDWLTSVLAAYRGRVIYRTYGQPYSLSEHLAGGDSWRNLTTRGNFAVIPFADESVRFEEPWFRSLCLESVPYQIPDDVFDHPNRWDPKISLGSGKIAVSIPNIENPYYAHAYHEFFSQFPEDHFRIYGPQRRMPADPRIMGELPRASYLSALAGSAGYFYPYRDRVSYLPPIEMMQLGGPVIAMSGSLLADFLGEDAPNIAESIDEAKAKLKRILAGDRRFVASLIRAQETVRRRYDRELVRDAIYRRLPDAIEGRNLPQPPYRIEPGRVARVSRAVDETTPDMKGVDSGPVFVVALHVNGFFHLRDGQATALEGIPRVMEHLVSGAAARTKRPVIVTAQPEGAAATLALFHDFIMQGKVEVLIIGTKNDTPAGRLLNRLQLIRQLNGEELEGGASVLIPHYYLFPEFILYEGAMSLFLFDYMPHLFPDEIFEGKSQDALNLSIGTALGRKSSVILTGSQFTASYLPESEILDESGTDKILVAPLPMLGRQPRSGSRTALPDARLRGLTPHEFLFYPTANRPNKQLPFLLLIFATLKMEYPDLKLLLTCDLASYPPTEKIANDYGLRDSIVLAPALAETDMRWAYINCAALCFTSAGEGNFPPQVLEALTYEAPIVASRLSAITDELSKDTDQLLLCAPGDRTAFVEALKYAMTNRAIVLRRQKLVLERLRNVHSLEQFIETVLAALPGEVQVSAQA